MDTLIAMRHPGSVTHPQLPSPDVIARGWLTDLVKFCREEIRVTKRRVTPYEVWERVQTRLDDDPITDDGEQLTLSPEIDKQTRAMARRIAEAASRATEIGLAVRL
jgi:hypothetical protein